MFPFEAVWSDPLARIDALTVWGVEDVPELAATGANQSTAVGLGAGAFLLVGAVLAAGVAVMRRRSVES